MIYLLQSKKLNEEVVIYTTSTNDEYPISHMDGLEIYSIIEDDEKSLDYMRQHDVIKYKRYKYNHLNEIIFEYERVKYTPPIGRKIYAELLQAKADCINSGYMLFIDK